jgi:hypothetical protein
VAHSPAFHPPRKLKHVDQQRAIILVHR